jgi:hypothetical protein
MRTGRLRRMIQSVMNTSCVLVFLCHPGSLSFGSAQAQTALVKPTIQIRDVAIAQFTKDREATLVVAVENNGMTGQEATVAITITDTWCGPERRRSGCDGGPDILYVPGVLQSDARGNIQSKPLVAGVTEFEWRVSTAKTVWGVKFIAGVVGCGAGYPDCKGVDIEGDDGKANVSGTLLFR